MDHVNRLISVMGILLPGFLTGHSGSVCRINLKSAFAKSNKRIYIKRNILCTVISFLFLSVLSGPARCTPDSKAINADGSSTATSVSVADEDVSSTPSTL